MNERMSEWVNEQIPGWGKTSHGFVLVLWYFYVFFFFFKCIIKILCWWMNWIKKYFFMHKLMKTLNNNYYQWNLYKNIELYFECDKSLMN